jgi:hypothetical protein
MLTVEKHFTINELAELLNMSFGKARLLIKDEPGVLKFGDKRMMYRIPESVVQRVLRRCSNPA